MCLCFSHLCRTPLLYIHCYTRSTPCPGPTLGICRVYTETDCRGLPDPGPAHHTARQQNQAGSGRSMSRSWSEGRCRGYTWGWRDRKDKDKSRFGSKSLKPWTNFNYYYFNHHYIDILAQRKKKNPHLLPSQGLLTCWSHSVPVQPGWQVQVKPRCPVGWQSPWTQAPVWQGWQPGSTPWPSHCLVVLCVVPEPATPEPSPAPRSWSFPLMYRFRRQPWKLVPLRPPELCCRDERPPEAEARSGIPGGRKAWLEGISTAEVHIKISKKKTFGVPLLWQEGTKMPMPEDQTWHIKRNSYKYSRSLIDSKTKHRHLIFELPTNIRKNLKGVLSLWSRSEQVLQCFE